MEVKLYDAEYRLMEIVWGEQPLPSMRLAQLAAERLGWKKSTTYTVLRKLCQRGLLQNEGGAVAALITKQQALRAQGQPLLEKCGGLPGFLNTFFSGRALTPQEVECLQRLIDQNRGEG